MRQEHFERLFEEHAQRLFAFLVYRTGDRALAEDLLADTFEAAYRARRRFDPRRGSETRWLYAIAVNRMRDVRRRQAAEQRALERVGGVAEAAVEEAFDLLASREALMDALAQLSEEEREAVALRFGADLPLKDVARATGVSMSAAEGRVYRGLRKLRELVEP